MNYLVMRAVCIWLHRQLIDFIHDYYTILFFFIIVRDRLIAWCQITSNSWHGNGFVISGCIVSFYWTVWLEVRDLRRMTCWFLKSWFVFVSQVPPLPLPTAAKEEQSLPLPRESQREGAAEAQAEGAGTRERKGEAAPKGGSPAPQGVLLFIFLQLLLLLVFVLVFTTATGERHQGTNRGREEETLLFLTRPLQRLIPRPGLRSERPAVRLQALWRSLQRVSGRQPIRDQTAFWGSYQDAVAGGGPYTVRPHSPQWERFEWEGGKQEGQPKQQQLQLFFLLIFLFFLLFIILFRQLWLWRGAGKKRVSWRREELIW